MMIHSESGSILLEIELR